MGGHAPAAEHAQHRHVLHEDGVGACRVELSEQLPGGLELTVVYYCVDRHVYTSPETVGVTAQLGYVVHRVAGSGACAEALGPNVNGISPMVDGCPATLKVARRSKKFERCHYSIRFMS